MIEPRAQHCLFDEFLFKSLITSFNNFSFHFFGIPAAAACELEKKDFFWH